MSWTPATSIGPRAAYPSRMRILSAHRESTDLFRSYREGFDLVGKDPSPGYIRLFTCRSTPRPFFSTFAHRLSKDRADARAHSRKRRWAFSAQFWCNLSSLDATLLSPLLCVANKELAEHLSPLHATLTKNIGGGGQRFFDVRTFSRFNVFPNYPFSFHNSCALFCTYQKLNPFVFKGFRTLSTATEGVLALSPHSATRRSSFITGIGGGGVFLTNRLLTPGGRSHGFIHIAGGLFAGITLALIAALKILKIILENFCARLAQAFSGGLVQCGFCPLLGRAIRMLTELHDSCIGAPIVLIVPLALSRHLLVQRVNQKVVCPQDEKKTGDAKNHEPLEHAAESTPSPKFIVADYWLAQGGEARQWC